MHHTIGIFIFPGFQVLDATGPAAVFEAADYFAGSGQGYTVEVVSVDGGLINSSGGMAVDSVPIGKTRHVDTLLVAGGAGTRKAMVDPTVQKTVAAIGKQCRRITSVCTGTFILAGAGLIDGCAVTTHWRHAPDLLQAFPKLRVSPDKIWVRDGKIWSSAGVTAGIDLALALVADDFGETVAQNTAREIVVYYKRPGGQSQFSTIEDLGARDNRFKPVLAWIRENIAQPIKVEQLADVAAMSPRNFTRQFQKSVGRTPAKAVEQIRVEAAKILIESSDLRLEQIANHCGFSDSEIMRRAFIRLFGHAPRVLRTHAET